MEAGSSFQNVCVREREYGPPADSGPCPTQYLCNLSAIVGELFLLWYSTFTSALYSSFSSRMIHGICTQLLKMHAFSNSSIMTVRFLVTLIVNYILIFLENSEIQQCFCSSL
jgi:hypothetical protein